MTIRDLRASDSPRLLELLRREFPEEERIIGTRPEGFGDIVRRVFRWDARIVLGVLRLFGRPVYRFFVVEMDGRLIAMTLLTFPARAGYVSMVAVDPAYRRRGFARQLLERSRVATAAHGRPYVALDVLTSNTPARTLYASLGYRRLRTATYLVHERPVLLSARSQPGAVGIRPFEREDAIPLARIVRAEKPPEVEAVLPTSPHDISGSAWAARILRSTSAAWVVDVGTGPVAWVAAIDSPATEAAHLSAPIIGPSVAPEDARVLVETAGAWCAARRAPRVTALVPEENRRGRAALETAGFRDALSLETLYRRSA